MYWTACSTRSVSSTLRPKPRLLMVACWMTPSLSMMKRPRSEMPPERTPYASEIFFDRSDTSGYCGEGGKERGGRGGEGEIDSD